jgi:lysophospholipase L1-like esterase
MKRLLIVLWVLLLPGCGEELPDSAATPIHRLRVGAWAFRHEQLQEQSKKGGIEVVFLGDSITHYWEWHGQQVWEERLRPLKSGNYGIGGDQTGHLLWRITTGNELDGITPKAAVLLIGTNNLNAGHTPEQVAEGIEAIVAELRRQKPDMKLLVLGIFPRSANPRDPIRDRVRQTNDIIRRLGDNKNVFFKDIGTRFLQKDGTLSKEVMFDYLHLSDTGYKIWADAIEPDLEKLLVHRPGAASPAGN